MSKVNQQANRTRWEGHVREWRRSGLTQTAYCREHGLLLSTFSAWLGRIKRSDALATPMTMVPVVVQGHDNEAKLHSPIHLQHHSGWQLQLPANVPADWLGQVLKSLA